MKICRTAAQNKIGKKMKKIEKEKWKTAGNKVVQHFVCMKLVRRWHNSLFCHLQVGYFNYFFFFY